MPFKLTKDHVGKKITHFEWEQDEPNWVLLEWVRDDYLAGISEAGKGFSTDGANFPEWEFYEDPKPEVWWEEGKVYRRKLPLWGYKYVKFLSHGWFPNMPGQVIMMNMKTPEPEPVDVYQVAHNIESVKQEDFEEYIPEKINKTIRMAPALVKIRSGEYEITSLLFKSGEAAIQQSNWDSNIFIQWPASENLWIEVPIQEGATK